MTQAGRRPEAGFSLVGAVASITIMLVLMGMAMPAWRYVMQDDREEELIFRGSQIADAIARYQRESKSLPVSMDVLVNKKFLRKAYKDPMTKHGKWRLIHPGEVIPPPLPLSGAAGRPGKPGESDEGGARGGRDGVQAERSGGAAPGLSIGPFMGVASTSKENSLRLFNGRSRYDQWIFAVGMPRIVGKPPVVMPGGLSKQRPEPAKPR